MSTVLHFPLVRTVNHSVPRSLYGLRKSVGKVPRVQYKVQRGEKLKPNYFRGSKKLKESVIAK